MRVKVRNMRSIAKQPFQVAKMKSWHGSQVKDRDGGTDGQTWTSVFGIAVHNTWLNTCASAVRTHCSKCTKTNLSKNLVETMEPPPTFQSHLFNYFLNFWQQHHFYWQRFVSILIVSIPGALGALSGLTGIDARQHARICERIEVFED